MPRMKGNQALDNHMASYGDAMVATAGLLSALGLPSQVQGYWTEHSERLVLPTGLSVLETPLTDKDILGTWKPEGSDTYTRSYEGRVARLEATFANTARRANHYEDLDERETASGFKDWLVGKDKLDGGRFWVSGEATAPTQIVEPVSESVEEAEAEASNNPSAKKLKTVELHRAGSYGCWMGRKRDFRDATEFDTKPLTSRYTHVCKLCWPPKADDEDSESGEASSAHTRDGEEPWYDDTWDWGGTGFGPHVDGAVDLGQTLYDFIRERM